MALNIQQLKAAMYNTPSNYKNSRDYYSENLSDKIQETYEWAQDTFDAQYETARGSRVYKDIVCRINHAISPITGLNRGEDYKKLIFFDLEQKRYIGEKFRFQNNTWICTNTDEYEFLTKQSIVRRCNNTIAYKDRKTGYEFIEECIIDYSMKYSTPYFNNVLTIPQGTIIVICQKNQNTDMIDLNDRIIFDTQVFKIKSINNFLREFTNESGQAGLITFECYIDEKAPDDNFITEIANEEDIDYIESTKPNYPEIIKFPNVDKILQDRSQDYSVYYYNEYGEKTQQQFTFTPSWIDDNYYILKILDGNNFRITNIHRNTEKPLIIKCSSDKGNLDINITLGGMY